jgi:hypothetical protein
MSILGVDFGEEISEHFHFSTAQTLSVQCGESEGKTIRFFRFLLTHLFWSNTLLLKLKPYATAKPFRIKGKAPEEDHAGCLCIIHHQKSAPLSATWMV